VCGSIGDPSGGTSMALIGLLVVAIVIMIHGSGLGSIDYGLNTYATAIPKSNSSGNGGRSSSNGSNDNKR
jgi:hypothetical protein